MTSSSTRASSSPRTKAELREARRKIEGLDLSRLTYYAARIEEKYKECRQATIIESAGTYSEALRIAYIAAADFVTKTSILFSEPRDLFDETNRDARVVLRLESGIGIKQSGRIRVLATDDPKSWPIFDKCVFTFGVIDDRDLLNPYGYWTKIYAEDGELLAGE